MTQTQKPTTDTVLVIGAGMAGIEASLTLAAAGKDVCLVERAPLFGGQVIKCEEVFADMECSTCMAAPKQQDVLQNERINLMTLTEVSEVRGEAGDFTVTLAKRARYVDPDACIGCNACFDPCPVTVPNEFEEGLGERKAVYVSCPGALPNVPMIDTEHCVRFAGEECTLCQEACVFEAIDYDQRDEEIEIHVSAIIVATGFELLGLGELPDVEYDPSGSVYSALELERLYASNGPTEGELVLRNGEAPTSAAIVHCAGREQVGYCSAVCCMIGLKFVHYLKDKLPDIEIHELVTDLCIPGKSYQPFYEKTEHEVTLTRYRSLSVAQRNGSASISYETPSGKSETLDVDMVVISPPLIATEGTAELAEKLGIAVGESGFYESAPATRSGIESGREGIYVVGCGQGPKDIARSVTQANAAVGRLLAAGR